ncbi:hypothetical protein [Halorussus litoreus]|uniref:hypothetical protein n=1 Tax=Halorussus litoreus TaxID=1710536 RepID=UPI000E284AD8|nr:hypothetical protein [Halorussus litoreus]
MNLALRLAVACLVIAAPTLLYLGLLRGLRWLRDDALLADLARSDDAPDDVSSAAASVLEKRPIRADGSGSTDDAERAFARPRRPPPPPAPRPESTACSNCGSSNMLGARYCGDCLSKLR